MTKFARSTQRPGPSCVSCAYLSPVSKNTSCIEPCESGSIIYNDRQIIRRTCSVSIYFQWRFYVFVIPRQNVSKLIRGETITGCLYRLAAIITPRSTYNYTVFNTLILYNIRTTALWLIMINRCNYSCVLLAGTDVKYILYSAKTKYVHRIYGLRVSCRL